MARKLQTSHKGHSVERLTRDEVLYMSEHGLLGAAGNSAKQGLLDAFMIDVRAEMKRNPPQTIPPLRWKDHFEFKPRTDTQHVVEPVFPKLPRRRRSKSAR